MSGGSAHPLKGMRHFLVYLWLKFIWEYRAFYRDSIPQNASAAPKRPYFAPNPPNRLPHPPYRLHPEFLGRLLSLCVSVCETRSDTSE